MSKIEQRHIDEAYAIDPEFGDLIEGLTRLYYFYLNKKSNGKAIFPYSVAFIASTT